MPRDETGATPRPGISYRFVLAVVLPLLVFVTGALLTGNAHVTTRVSIQALAGSLFSQIADETAERARAHLAQAPPAVDMLAALFRADATPPSDDETARRLLAVVRANPGFTWTSFSQPDGTYIAVRRSEGRLIVSEGRIELGKTRWTERLVESDAVWTPLRTNDDDGYDPRERPFYRRAVAAKKRVWLDPYLFVHDPVLGISCAAPVYEASGALRGVVDVDFDLDALSQFVAGLRASEHARVFVYTRDGTILAHPALRRAALASRGAARAMLTKDNIADELVRAYFAGGEAGGFELGGTRYLSATRSFEPDEGLSWRVGAVAPEADFMAGLQATTRFALTASLLAVAFAVGLSMALTGRIAAPLAHLSAQMERVGRLDIDAAAPPPSPFREIELMNRALAAMKSGLSSFASYVPKEVVRAMLRSGQQATLGGTTKPITVLFSDLAGFTSLSERMAPAELVDVLGVYFDAMTQIIGAHGGTVDKFIGDAIMAFWNAPADDPDHAVHACEAALACARRLEELNAGGGAFALLSARIGVATGDVLVGNIGSHERINYTVMGEAVNLASRLEGLNKAYGTAILVSEAAREAAKDGVVLRAVDRVAVKGSTRGVVVYEPLALAGDAEAVARAELCAEAFGAYQARRFDEASALYAELLRRVPSDPVAATMKARAERYRENPPPDDWDGVVVMKEK